MNFPLLERQTILQRLERPNRAVSAVMDTDTYNEIDDQFALVYALLCPEFIKLEGVLAAPFWNERSSSPEDGMEKSYREILKLLNRMRISSDRIVFAGSRCYLPDRETPVDSPAAWALIEKAKAAKARGELLYVLAIGAITNVASALLLCPEIVDCIVIVWLGGHPYSWLHNGEFNLKQDVAAAQVVFDCGAPLVHIPCKNVAEHLNSSIPEMEYWVKGRGAIGDYLFESFAEYVREHHDLSKVVWDIAATAVLAAPEFMPSQIVPSPILNDDKSWHLDAARHPIRVITDINRDGIFRDLFTRLARFADSQ